jgi:hypothetical protein
VIFDTSCGNKTARRAISLPIKENRRKSELDSLLNCGRKANANTFIKLPTIPKTNIGKPTNSKRIRAIEPRRATSANKLDIMLNKKSDKQSDVFLQ